MKPHLNKGLFSNYYLDELLPREEEFRIPSSYLEGTLEKIKRIWDRKYFSSLNEPQLRKHFLDKVLEILDWTIDVEPPTPSGEWSRHPDYALFRSKKDLKIAQTATKEEYFKKSLCIGEVKCWGRPLDKKIKVDPEDPQNPSLQISRYLWLTEVKWGILTDGRYWRLYERETSKRLDIFYEIDLENIIENGFTEDFKYFYLFFRRDAFPDFIERVYKGSVDYAEAVGKELKENVYQALKILAQGFLKTPGNDLKEAHLKEIHDNSLILLYRLLFILYAEYRGLLPIGENRLYTDSYSLDALKKEIAASLDRSEHIATSTHGYWNRLKELFETVNIGNTELEVPPYNGGLFDPDKHEFFEKYRVGDLFIAKTVDLLSRSSDRAYIDYGSLEIRHLGSIYEGLLEYKLRIAEEDIVSIKEKGKEVFVTFEKAKQQKKKVKEQEIIRKGEVYLVTDKGERKATGSYYTPDYIVKYIIENTLGPLIEEKRGKVSEKIQEIKEKIRKTRGYDRKFLERELREVEGSLLDEILSIKVLDPAMGSGHFLVEATDFLARELLKVLSGEPLQASAKEMLIKETPEPYGGKEPEEDIRWARREVVEKCIFGVDLNPLAVELAKLSLWLYTVAKNSPLNFLDHHLRCGNSLIGANIGDLVSLPEVKKKKVESAFVQLGLFESIFKEKVNILLGAFAQIEGLPSDTVEQIREKGGLYNNFRKIVSRFQDVADVWTSVYFQNDELTQFKYQMLENNLRVTDEEWDKLSQESWFKKAKEMGDKKRFFHWELEFPEVFFEGHQRKENPGFDAAIGNPPYLLLQPQNVEKKELNFYKEFKISTYKIDIYHLFIEKCIYLLRNQAKLSFITPASFLTNNYTKNLRSFILENSSIKQIVTIPDGVFPEVSVDNVVFVFERESDKHNRQHNKVEYLTAHVQDEDLRISSSTYIDQLTWSTDKDHLYLPKLAIQLPASKRSMIPLGEIATVNFGMQLRHRKKFPQDVVCAPKHPPTGKYYVPCYQGEDIQRYDLFYSHLYAYFNPVAQCGGCWDKTIHFAQGKLIVRQIGKYPIVAYDYRNYCCLNAMFMIVPYHKEYSSFYLLGLLNSSYLKSYWQDNFYDRKQTFPKIKGTYLLQLPIRSIAFTTSNVEREKRLKEMKELYEEYLGNKDWGQILSYVNACLSKSHIPDSELLKKYNADPLNKDWQIPEGAVWEQSDVVHDILAFLAEQMMEMNNEKQKEIKGFLGWLESRLKIRPDVKGNTGIEALSGKTQIKNYLGDYQKGEEHLSFEEFWKILERNKAKIQANLKSRELFETVKTEYEKSLSRLLPLKEKLRKTDWLIDQIIYRLYGLTAEEIKLVENVG